MESEKNNQQCEAKLEKIQEEFRNFVYIVSHDFKAPLRSIKHLSEWIEEDYGDQVPKEAKKDLGTMRNCVSKLEKMLEGLLELSRVGRMPQCIDSFNFKQTIEDIIEAKGCEKKVSVDVQENISELVTDRTLLKQVLAHLVENAVKFNPNEHPKVELSVRDVEDFIEISISDNGPGIPPEHHEKVFGVFASLIPQSQMENTGMGLPIVKKIVENFGGTIELGSGAHQGTTVRFYWPKLMEAQ
jgi:signal transduction histidine kinase